MTTTPETPDTTPESTEDDLHDFTVSLTYPVRAKNHGDAMRQLGQHFLRRGIGEFWFRVTGEGESNARIFVDGQMAGTDESVRQYLEDTANRG